MIASRRRGPPGAADQRRHRPAALRAFDATQDPRGGSARGDAHHHVAFPDADPIEFVDGAVGIVLGPFARSTQRGVAARDHPEDPFGIGVEGRRALRRIEHAESTAGSRPEVEQSTAGGERSGRRLDEGRQRRRGRDHRVHRALLVLGEEPDQGLDVHLVERSAVRVASLGVDVPPIGGQSPRGRVGGHGWSLAVAAPSRCFCRKDHLPERYAALPMPWVAVGNMIISNGMSRSWSFAAI